MQANQLWAETEYAYLSNRPKGVETPHGARRVRVDRVYRRRMYGGERFTTFVDMTLLDNETGEPIVRDGVVRTRAEIRAYDIVDFWDEYADRVAEREARAAAAEAERVRIQEEQAREQERQMQAFCDYTGLPREMVLAGNYGDFIVSKSRFMKWYDSQSQGAGIAS